MRGKKIKLLASVIGIILVVIAVIAGFGWKEHKLEDAQQEFTSLIEAKEGNYNENKVVLSSTTKEEAQEMADAFGGNCVLQHSSTWDNLKNNAKKMSWKIIS